MTTVIYVHGTGVRKDVYDESFDRIEEQLRAHSKATLKRCYWGHLGSDLLADGASIPTYDTARAAVGEWGTTTVSDEDCEVALWGALYEDPLFELQLLALRGGVAGTSAPGRRPPGVQLAELGGRFTPSSELQTLLTQGGISSEFEPARAAVTGSNAYKDACNGATTSLEECRCAIARAFVSAASQRVAAADQPRPAIHYDAALRDQTERVLVELLGGKERALGGWLKDRVKGLASRVISWQLKRKRGAVTDAAFPAAGDILLYQARGNEIQQFISKEIAKAEPPRVLLAHSLGGIASVDLLVGDGSGVDLLITVGSQAPFLYELNALQSLPFGSNLPTHFPKWINIYDLRDTLSFVGERLFPGRVTDIEVNNRQPFPASHSAYWSNKRLWQALAPRLP